MTKVIYLPDPEFQELALAGVETLVSTRLDPGVDPIVEADRRGAILAIVRLGNKDLEMPDGDGGGELSVRRTVAVRGLGRRLQAGRTLCLGLRSGLRSRRRRASRESPEPCRPVRRVSSSPA